MILSTLRSCLIAVIATQAITSAYRAPHLLLTFCFVREKFPWKAQEPHTLCSFKGCLKTSDSKCSCLVQIETITCYCLFDYLGLSRIPVLGGGGRPHFHFCLMNKHLRSLGQRLASAFSTFRGTIEPCCKAGILSS